MQFVVDASVALSWCFEDEALCEHHRLTVYDAAYLELAQRKGLPLATLDSALSKAAFSEKVTLIAPA